MCQASDSETGKDYSRMDEESGLTRLGQDGYPFGDVSVVEKSSCDE
jgi:hypothetical protein